MRASALAAPEQTATFQFTVTPSTRPEFALAVGPGVLTVNPDSSVRASVVVTRSGGFAGNVALSVANLPAGITPLIDAPVLAAGRTTATIEFRVARDVPYQLYFPIVRAIADGMPAMADTVTLRVTPTPAFSIELAQPTNPGTVLRFLGATRQSLGLNVVREGGYSRAITLAIDGLPAGVRYPVPTVIPNGVGGVSADLDVDPTAQIGSYPITIRARGDDGFVSTTRFALIIGAVTGSYSLLPSAREFTVRRGDTLSFAITLTRAGSVNSVALSLEGGAPNIVGTITRAISGFPTETQVMQLRIVPNAVAGEYAVTLRGRSPGLPDVDVPLVVRVVP